MIGCSNDDLYVNVCGSAHCGCVVNGSVAMAAFLVLSNSIEHASWIFLYYSLSNLVECARLRSSSIASTNTESTDTGISRGGSGCSNTPLSAHFSNYSLQY